MNTELKKIIRMSGLYQWQIAEEIGISEATFTRWMRSKLSDENKRKILDAIKALTKNIRKEVEG